MSQVLSKEKFWLNKLYRKSESKNTLDVAKSSLKAFDIFCLSQFSDREKMIEYYQSLFNKEKPNIQEICESLDKFVDFLTKDHENCKKKNPKTIKYYFSFIKSYLRLCHGIKISTEDVKDYVTFPRVRKEPRKPLDLRTVKKIMGLASPKRRALYYVLVTSGMRLGEALSLRNRHIHTKENPVRITIDAETTKTKEGRNTFITSEAFEKLKPFLSDKEEDKDQLIFTHFDDPYDAVNAEIKYFYNLRERLGLTEKYHKSVRHVVSIHRFRSYFHTKASQKHGPEYANAMDGHSGYLKQYFSIPDEDFAKLYKELEPGLLIDSVPIESDKNKDKIIAEMQEQMKKMQDKMRRIELLQK